MKLMHCNKKVINLAAWVYHQDRMLSSESPCCCLSAFSSLPSNGEAGREKYIHFPKWCRPGSHLPMSISDCRGPFNWTKCVKHLCFSKCALKNIPRIKERAQSLTHWPFGKTNQLKIHCKLRIETQLPEYRVPLHVYCFIASHDKPLSTQPHGAVHLIAHGELTALGTWRLGCQMHLVLLFPAGLNWACEEESRSE